MRIHILGICGTFMAGIAVLAKQAGYDVSGSDEQVYPPMSTQLAEQGIQLSEGYHPQHLQPAPDLVIIGNAMSRGNPAVEYVLNQKIPYISGPQWLYEHILKHRTVIAVAGTHGKTTTTAMICWILEQAGLEPGFLVGGVPRNFPVSARLGKAPYFVIEADEYDSAFFDKRSKFIHYQPTVALLNNLEYDHADIFPNLDAIKLQFQYLIRTVPANGLIVMPSDDANLSEVLTRGCWTPIDKFSLQQKVAWQGRLLSTDGSEFEVLHHQQVVGRIQWDLLGLHNVNNAIAAIAVCHFAGVSPAKACAALTTFKSVKRRLEVRGVVNNITVYDDFAHHPTAIATTIAGLRQHIGAARLIAILQLASYTMKAGVHGETLVPSLRQADSVLMLQPEDYDVTQLLQHFKQPAKVATTISELVKAAVSQANPGDHILVMSNRGFGGIHEQLLHALS